MTGPATKSAPSTPLCDCVRRDGTGETCRRPAGWGTDHPGFGPCKLHGGKFPSVADHHRKRMLEAKVRGQLVQKEITPITDPVGAYGDLAGEVWAFKELCREKIAELTEWDYSNQMGTEDVAPVLALYQSALRDVQKTLGDMLRIGLSHEAIKAARERPSREQAEALSNVIQALLDGLGLTDEQRALVPEALSAALRKEGLM